METARLKAFIEATEHGSIKAAADSLGYTPSAISQLISALEKELGLTLLKRSQKGVSLTAEGEALVPLVRSYLASENEVYRFASELKGVTVPDRDHMTGAARRFLDYTVKFFESRQQK